MASSSASASPDACCDGLAKKPTAAQVASMSVKDLKAFLADRGIATADCLEKADFVAKVKAVLDAPAPATATAAAPNNTKSNGSAAGASASGLAAASATANSSGQKSNGSSGSGGKRTALLGCRQVGPLKCNMCIIGDPSTKRAVLVDPGGDPQQILDEIKALGVTVVQIVVTHAHFDHFLAAGDIKAATGAPICLNKADEQLWKFLPMQCALMGLPAPTKAMPPPDAFLGDGDKLSVLDGVCIATPGHSPGSTCFYWPSQKLLCSGDTLFRMSVGRTDLMGGDAAALKRSIQEKLYALPDDTEVIPGHMDRTTIGFEKQHNSVIRAPSSSGGFASLFGLGSAAAAPPSPSPTSPPREADPTKSGPNGSGSGAGGGGGGSGSGRGRRRDYYTALIGAFAVSCVLIWLFFLRNR